MENQKQTQLNDNEEVPDALNRSTENEHPSGSRPVGYGSSIQTSGHGNRSRPRDPDKDLDDSENEIKSDISPSDKKK